MIISIYGDVHLTKNMRNLQDLWDSTAKKSIYSMYDHFDELGVEMAVCLGDFFDAPRLEAKHMNLVLPILESINSRSYPTYILLGNHEIDSDDSNILEFISNYENIHPVTDLLEMEGMFFIPYNINPQLLQIKDQIIFTHHDIYGSELAGGKTKAFFGIDAHIFDYARIVWNGHVHLKSTVGKVINAGSLLVSQQGELRIGEYPNYYTMDTKSLHYDTYENTHAMIYLTVDEQELDQVENKGYDTTHCVLKIEYSGEIPEMNLKTAHVSWRKKIESIGEDMHEEVQHNNFNMTNYLVEYIQKDTTVIEKYKADYIKTGVSLLS